MMQEKDMKNTKNKIFLILLLILGLTLIVGCENSDSKNESSNGASNKIETTTLDGKKFTSEDVAKNKLTVLNVWGTWCDPCVRELPELEKVSKKFKGKDVEIVGVLQDGIKDINVKDENVIKLAESTLEKGKVTYKIILPDEYLYTEFIGKMQYFPTTFFLNSKGEVIKVEAGAHSAEEWSQIINETLSEIEK